MDDFVYPIGESLYCGKKVYSYLCNDCGKTVNGYKRCRVRGKVRCYKCLKKYRQEQNQQRLNKDYECGRKDLFEESIRVLMKIDEYVAELYQKEVSV